MLEETVDERFYLSEQRIESVLKHKERNREKGNRFGVRFVSPEDVASTLTTSPDRSAGQYLMVKSNTKKGFDECFEGEKMRIRKLTPKECFRLMGFDDRDHDVLSENGISNTQIYKMAGNSIVVDVLEEIFVDLLNTYAKELRLIS